MTGWQRLRLVELPFAVPIVLGGVRVATVASVGMATIAAAIGVRGLGSYIFRGVAPRITVLICRSSALGAAGAGPLRALGEAERPLDLARPRNSRRRGWSPPWRSVSCSPSPPGAGRRHPMGGSNRPTITIGSKDGSEMILLGHMLADLVQAHTPLRVDRRFNLGGTLVCYNALRLGGLDAYVEYTGTALMMILKAPVQTDPQAVLERVRTERRTATTWSVSIPSASRTASRS